MTGSIFIFTSFMWNANFEMPDISIEIGAKQHTKGNPQKILISQLLK